MQKRIHIQGKSYRIPNSPNFLAIENATKKWSMPLRDWKQAINQFMMLFPDRMPIKFNGGLHRFFYTLITVGGINCENLACNKRAVHLCKLPIFIIIRTKPLRRFVMPLIFKAYSDSVVHKAPQFFLKSIFKLFRPLTYKKSLNSLPTRKKSERLRIVNLVSKRGQLFNQRC